MDLLKSALDLLVRSGWWTAAAIISYGVSARGAPEWVRGKCKEIIGRHPKLDRQWEASWLLAAAVDIMKMPGPWGWALTMGFLFMGFVNVHNDDLKLIASLEAVKVFQEDVSPEECSRDCGESKGYITKVVFFSNKKTEPTSILITTSVILTGCDVNTLFGSNGGQEAGAEVLAKNHKVCDVGINRPVIRPTMPIEVLLYSDEPIDREVSIEISEPK